MRCKGMTRRSGLALTAWTLVLLYLAGWAVADDVPTGVEPARPNILWITSEDNGPHLGAYGDEYADTPTLDALAAQGVIYTNASSNAPVCAPARSTLITGMYAPSLGSHHMRSRATLPYDVRFFTEYLREVGYYCTNNSKQDYNIKTPKGAWDESSRKAHWRNREPGQPFFSVFNITVTHESRIWPKGDGVTEHDPAKVVVPPYHPARPEVRRDWAQYYDNLTKLDGRVAAILEQLDEDGLADDTIVYYFADHGPGMPRGKRWLYQSGLHVPLIIRFPEKFRTLAPAEPGGQVDRLVSFVDFAPTVLSLAGVTIPDHIQGEAFLGPQDARPRQYTFGHRDRMDERYDMSRSVFDGRYKYIHNYYSHRPYAQYLTYQYRNRTQQVWQELYDTFELLEVQAAFFQAKPIIELYDTHEDPYEVNNLVGSLKHLTVRASLERTLREWMLEIVDLGLLPEDELRTRAGGGAEYDMARNGRSYQIERLIDAAVPEALDRVVAMFNDDDSVVRYWAAVECVRRGEGASRARDQLIEVLNDEAPSVRIAAAEALCGLDESDRAMPVLVEALRHDQIEVQLQAAIVLDHLDHAALPVAVDMARAAMNEKRIAGDGSGCVQRVVTKALADLASLPPGATVLFGGGDMSSWTGAEGGAVDWKIIDGGMQIAPGSGSIITNDHYRDFRLHVEFNLPESPPDAKGQGRGNSGVYIQRRYEVQILDSFGRDAGKHDCGALYNTRPPDRNAARKPGQWQSYDITFRSPRWTGEGKEATKVENARITVIHNGVLIHDDVELPNKTGAGRPEGPEPGPILLQDHGHAVRFRNIWIMPLE